LFLYKVSTGFHACVILFDDGAARQHDERLGTRRPVGGRRSEWPFDKPSACRETAFSYLSSVLKENKG
jgi:hypothetical protein